MKVRWRQASLTCAHPGSSGKYWHLLSPPRMLQLLQSSPQSNRPVPIFVTGPAKTGHVGTNYTLFLYRSYLSTVTEYFHSVTCIIIIPNKFVLSTEHIIAIAC